MASRAKYPLLRPGWRLTLPLVAVAVALSGCAVHAPPYAVHDTVVAAPYDAYPYAYPYGYRYGYGRPLHAGPPLSLGFGYHEHRYRGGHGGYSGYGYRGGYRGDYRGHGWRGAPGGHAHGWSGWRGGRGGHHGGGHYGGGPHGGGHGHR